MWIVETVPWIVETVPMGIEFLIIELFILFIELLIVGIIVSFTIYYLGEKFGLLIAKTLFPSLPTKFQVFTKELKLYSRESVILIGVLLGIVSTITILVLIIMESFFIDIEDIESFFKFPVYYYISINIPTLFIPIITFISAVITVILYAWRENINIKNKQSNEVTTRVD